MFYRNELLFLCKILQKSHIHAQILTPAVDRVSPASFPIPEAFQSILSSIDRHTLYRLNDASEQCYCLLPLPDTQEPTVLYVGPLRSGDSPLLEAFCETIWEGSDYAVVDMTKADAPISQSMRNLRLDDSLASIKAIEERYAFENEMIRAVHHGQIHMEARFRAAFSMQFLEKRHSDPLRNAQHYSIIMNTLLRKAAEQGGVHPIHLDQISADFAGKIENLLSLRETTALMCEMFRTYCYLVRKHSLQQFSPIVQNTILMIDVDLSADLTPGALAQAQSVSLGYLSTIFKKETKQTVCAYIRKRRMEYAAHLLSTTKLQIQTVALHCGIMDAQYFSKLFKAHYKKTPSEYRSRVKRKGPQ